MHVGTYPTRNCALKFLFARTLGLYLHPSVITNQVGCATFGLYLVACGLSSHYCKEGNCGLGCSSYNRSNPEVRFRRNVLHLRTIIVIADIDRGLHSSAQHINTLHPPCLTFRHWSGVTPYTSTYVFAGSCVFDKQLPGNLSLRPQTYCYVRAGLIPKLRPLFCRVP